MTPWLLAAGLGVACLSAAAVTLRRLQVLREAVARADHEVRGPLCAARLGLELVARSAAPPTAQLRALELELDRMALAVADLERLRGGGSSGGMAPVEVRPVAVGQLLEDCVHAWRPAARARGVPLDGRWSGPPGAWLADRVRLAQALENLIANALEHGCGPVQVRGCVDGCGVRLEVVDHGPGLPAPLRDLVARRRRGAGRQRGRGLGIALAAAQAHAGELTTAPSRSGARLVLRLPLRPAAARPTVSRSET